ncbi:hypothetical protein M758_8G084800 [Ceratodon purpureus]|nr:hypothetical protein M758_8G084800 [Ceratodon purpureus]
MLVVGLGFVWEEKVGLWDCGIVGLVMVGLLEVCCGFGVWWLGVGGRCGGGEGGREVEGDHVVGGASTGVPSTVRHRIGGGSPDVGQLGWVHPSKFIQVQPSKFCQV